jgi:hypothetical protein
MFCSFVTRKGFYHSGRLAAAKVFALFLLGYDVALTDTIDVVKELVRT